MREPTGVMEMFYLKSRGSGIHMRYIYFEIMQNIYVHGNNLKLMCKDLYLAGGTIIDFHFLFLN